MDIHNKQKIGSLTVIDADFITDDYGKRMALVECTCSARTTVRVANLKTGHTTTCGRCTKRGGARPHPYKSRKKVTTPRGKAFPVTTPQVAVDERQARAE
jgi:hypothetical protein